MGTENKSETSKKNRNKSKKITFDDEIISKDSIPTIQKDKKSGNKKLDRLQHKALEGNTINHNTDPLRYTDNIQHKKKKSKNKKKRSNLNAEDNDETKFNSVTTENLEANTNEEEEDDDDVSEAQAQIESELVNTNNVTIQKEESIRARKRRKHMELLQAKKLRHEVDLQQKCLNYLSLWKHSRSQWKFEKLKQIWLQQNMFDDTKIPDEFWDTLVEYFNSAKGQAKSSLLSGAVKIVDSVEEMDDESPEKTNVKYLRARNIVQNIQE
ncbi:WKF domain [Popillia japonica]|uniref:WKF domain n=1 Tax=Popillia japonica TaxID=7064 RepID=A0AAW1NLX1_POPJA